ncbi:MAG: S8 family serine peptidase [Thermoflexales bacterium]|nr:S8 family serine peptidase [Thermoflexales bacterium]
MNRTTFKTILLATAAVLTTVAAGRANAAPALPKAGGELTDSPNGIYLVEMADSPAIAYSGGVAGYKATAPGQGKKIDPLATDVLRYNAFLDSKHDAALASVGAQGRKTASYHFSYNGFAAKLSPTQAAALKRQPGVVNVVADELQTVDTSSTPAFLGLNAPGGLWEQLGGIGLAGDGIIIGIIDTGIWPENPSFSDRTGLNGNGSQDGKLDYQQIPGWHGKCTPGQAFPASSCNQKLIGAQWFNAAFGGDAGAAAAMPWEFMSARDFGGHGSHTASTSGGNANVPVNGPASVFGSISGIAPHARIAAYKALWEVSPGQGSGYNSDLVAAIDQAVADGVDVINYSISGTQTNFRDPVQISFLYAAQAGIFVAASAGNSGPTTATVAHPGPWLTTVAAGTHNRGGSGSVTLGNGATYYGASLAPATGPYPLIDSVAAGFAGADATQLALCYGAADGVAPVLDPAKVAGKIVVCDRGVTARVNKSQAVKDAGGVGMILLNPSANSLNADFHAVPTVHLQNTDRAAVKAYAATPGATAKINAATITYAEPAPFTASFSSRGPLRASSDLLKPDLIAPGQDILAAVAPPGNGGRWFDLYSGTSMSSPHVAGLAALLKQAHPDWTPAMIKSALMTTGGDVLDGPNTNPLVIFRQGAGHVRPNKAVDPGLVFNAGWSDWLSFICAVQGSGLASTCAAFPVIDPSDFNGASIAIGELAGSQTVTRRVTNVGSQAETYTASYTGLGGIQVGLPGSFTVAKGATQSLSFSFRTTTAALNSYVGGQITLTGDKGHVVRFPAVIRPVALAAPGSVSSAGGAISYNVVFGYNGSFTASARGLVPAAITADTVADDPTDSTCSLSSPNAKIISVAVPAGTTYARFSLFDADVNAGSDLDLCVFNGAGTLVGASGSGTSAEEVNLVNPAAGTYSVVVQGWGVAGTTPFKLHTWQVGSTSAGNMTVSAPATAVLAGSGTINLSFTGLTPGVKYVGSVAYGGASGMPSPTIVSVNP